MTILEALALFTYQTLLLVRGAAFFSQAGGKRKADIEAAAPEGYPRALREYLAQRTAEAFADDMRAALDAIASRRIAPDLAKTAYWTACAYGLCEQIERFDHPASAGDLQAFIERMSPLRCSFVQTPTALPAEEKKAFRTFLLGQDPGFIPLFSVEPSLGGGARRFQGGLMTDHSWTGMAAHTLDILFAR